jgi:hypothetical protein
MYNQCFVLYLTHVGPQSMDFGDLDLTATRVVPPWIIDILPPCGDYLLMPVEVILMTARRSAFVRVVKLTRIVRGGSLTLVDQVHIFSHFSCFERGGRTPQR